MKRALVSIHDVMPETIGQVADLLNICRTSKVKRVTLLVVPGLDWQPQQIDLLREWEQQGFELAGHGWVHRCQSIKRIYHRLHSTLISRNVAEHLELRGAGVSDLIHRCSDWFDSQRFQRPTLYVPPAWALGTISQQELRQLPFKMIETLRGVVWTQNGRRLNLPLHGYEADTQVRRFVLSGLNRASSGIENLLNLPVRVSIHPSDHVMLLKDSLLKTLAVDFRDLSYRSLVRLPKQRLATDALEANGR